MATMKFPVSFEKQQYFNYKLWFIVLKDTHYLIKDIPWYIERINLHIPPATVPC